MSRPAAHLPASPSQALVAKLARIGQSHLLNFLDRLPGPSQASLLAQIESLDLEALPVLIERYVKRKPTFELPAGIEPAPYFPKDATSKIRPWDRGKAKAAGEALLREGKVAAFVVAGGQGSRLGYDGPKGCYPAGAITRKPLFQIFAENLLAVGRRYGRPVPWCIMTSPLNHAATVSFFEAHRFFGLDRGQVMFFPQGVLPSLDIKTGQVLMTSPGEIATNPDGHGGSIKALHVSGALDDLRRRGVTQLSYFQVDNPLVRPVDPVFIGLHASSDESSGEMSSKMIPKAYAEEKMGLFCKVPSKDSAQGGRIEVIEYSDLPMDLQRQTLKDGSLRFLAGSIAVHIISVEFVQRLATDPAFDLPYHRAEKKIPCIDPATGAAITPTANNGVKLERFVFDALPMCKRSIVLETDRVEEFAPIKNASGVDSAESSAKLQTERAARWLESVGIAVPRTPPPPASPTGARGEPDCILELSPLTALEPDDLRPLVGTKIPKTIERGARLAL
jgi:UDP-N-acetylglucosamine/UDP-N-acetylgalactosamine diphosphorylase